MHCKYKGINPWFKLLHSKVHPFVLFKLGRTISARKYMSFKLFEEK